MKIELIPIVEIGYNNVGVTPPSQYPYWKHPEVWDKYHAECYARAGFKDEWKPYLPGSSFYRLTDICDNNLTRLAIDHTEDLRLGKYERLQACAFFGGYVLRINEQDKYFPQCCGDLSDVQYWSKLAINRSVTFYSGHPAPVVTIKGDIIIFDFTEYDEAFSPTPPDTKISFDIHPLQQALNKVMIELEDFASRLKKINAEENLNIDEIDKLLIWGDE